MLRRQRDHDGGVFRALALVDCRCVCQYQLIELAKSQKYEAAGALGRRVQALADVVFAPPVANYRARLKEGLVMLGVMEHAYVREPLLPISDSERSQLRDALVEAGLLAPSGLARVAS